MTESEALKCFKDANRTYDMVCVLPKSDIGKCVMQALEKQIPKKTVFVHVLQDDDCGDYMCPSCKSGSVLDAYGNKPQYCHYCGQKLDWSGE